MQQIVALCNIPCALPPLYKQHLQPQVTLMLKRHLLKNYFYKASPVIETYYVLQQIITIRIKYLCVFAADQILSQNVCTC